MIASPRTGWQQPASWKATPDGRPAIGEALDRRSGRAAAQRQDLAAVRPASPVRSSARSASITSRGAGVALADRRQQIVDGSCA